MDVLDVGRLRKVNDLAKTLSMHGLAANREEAAQLASELQHGQDEDQMLNHMRVTADQRMVVINKAAEQMSQQYSEQKKDYYSKEEVETVLQDFASMFGDEIKKLNAEIEGLHSKIEALNATQAFSTEEYVVNDSLEGQPKSVHIEPLPELSPRVVPEEDVSVPVQGQMQQAPQVQQHPQVAAQQAQVQQVAQQQQTLTQQQPVQQKPEPTSHPRTGSFNTQDVSIEKLFYYGTR